MGEFVVFGGVVYKSFYIDFLVIYCNLCGGGVDGGFYCIEFVGVFGY